MPLGKSEGELLKPQEEWSGWARVETMLSCGCDWG